MHGYKTQGRDNYRIGGHKIVVYKHLFSQAGDFTEYWRPPILNTGLFVLVDKHLWDV